MTIVCLGHFHRLPLAALFHLRLFMLSVSPLSHFIPLSSTLCLSPYPSLCCLLSHLPPSLSYPSLPAPAASLNPLPLSPLVIHGDVAEQVGHGLSVVDSSDGLGQDHADVHRLDLGTLELLQLVGDGVGHHHLREREKGFSFTLLQNF